MGEFDRGLDNDTEGALGADEQAGQVVSGDALGGGAAGPDAAAVAEDDVEGKDRVAGHSVLHAPQSTGVGSDVAADARDRGTRRIGGVTQPVCPGGRVEVGGDHTGLHPGGGVVRVDLDDAIHPGDVQDDLPGTCGRAPGQARPGASGDHRNPGPARVTQDSDDIVGGRGAHDRVGNPVRDQTRSVGAHPFEVLRVGGPVGYLRQ